MSNIELALIGLVLLNIKHFIADYLLQADYMLEQKGIYGALGGLHHSAIHGVGTFFSLIFLYPAFAFLAAIFDFLVHYHIDWAKVNITKKIGIIAQDYRFWALFGADQFWHNITYIVIIGWAAGAF